MAVAIAPQPRDFPKSPKSTTLIMHFVASRKHRLHVTVTSSSLLITAVVMSFAIVHRRSDTSSTASSSASAASWSSTPSVSSSHHHHHHNHNHSHHRHHGRTMTLERHCRALLNRVHAETLIAPSAASAILDMIFLTFSNVATLFFRKIPDALHQAFPTNTA